VTRELHDALQILISGQQRAGLGPRKKEGKGGTRHREIASIYGDPNFFGRSGQKGGGKGQDLDLEVSRFGKPLPKPGSLEHRRGGG